MQAPSLPVCELSLYGGPSAFVILHWWRYVFFSPAWHGATEVLAIDRSQSLARQSSNQINLLVYEGVHRRDICCTQAIYYVVLR